MLETDRWFHDQVARAPQRGRRQGAAPELRRHARLLLALLALAGVMGVLLHEAWLGPLQSLVSR